MIEAGAHVGFIVAAYGVTVVTIAGLCLWIVLDGRRQKRQLAELDAKGIRRRSAKEQT